MMKQLMKPALALALSLMISASPALAQTWNGSSSGLWSLAANWSALPLSGTGTQLTFASGATNKTMNHDLAAGFIVNQLTFDGSGYGLSGNSLSLQGTTPQLVQSVSGLNTVATPLSFTAASTVAVNHASGELQLDAALTSANLGLTKTGAGMLTLTNASNNFGTGSFTVDGGGVTVKSGGQLNHRAMILSPTLGDSSTALVTGAGSQLTNSDVTFVGNRGTASLTIQNGGVVTNTVGVLGRVSGSNGTALVDGTGSRWTNSANLNVGEGGTGSLTIQNGGVVTNTTSTLGNASTGNGTVLVTGVGSQWNSNVLTVGGIGTGSLTIQNGGEVSVTAGTTINSGTIVNNGTLTTPIVTIKSGGTLKGTGTLTGNYTLDAGGSVVFGNSPGTLTTGSAIWNSGGLLTFQTNDATGVAGTNWSQNVINTTLTINATSASPLLVTLESFNALNNGAALANFNPAQNYSWVWVEASGGISGFSPDKFQINVSPFASFNALNGGTFGVTRSGNQLRVNFFAASAPEPGSLILLALGIVGGAAVRRRRLG